MSASDAEVRRLLEDQSLGALRRRTAVDVASELERASGRIIQIGEIFGDGRITGRSPRGNGDDSVVALGVIVGITGELVGGCAELLASDRQYAAAALARQLVEVEYLARAISDNKRDGAQWLNSTREERRKAFGPAALRRANEGRYGLHDYHLHCEQGGHPVPDGAHLIGPQNTYMSEAIIVDVLGHTLGIVRSLITWAQQVAPSDPVGSALCEAGRALASWASTDALPGQLLASPR